MRDMFGYNALILLVPGPAVNHIVERRREEQRATISLAI
jgi:hypothetical protein